MQFFHAKNRGYFSMNHAYRLVWSDAAARFVPAPETAKGRGKSSGRGAAVVALCVALLASGAWAGPSGGSVSAGSGSISQSGATTTITQASQNLSINWASFGIAAGERVNFVQPGASAIALNRVVGSESSVINGSLSANGQVWILNPNGVLFGSTASVNVGGLVASTLSLSDADFLAGKRSFSANGGQGTVVNQGSLTGGYVALLGKQAGNSGTITTANGTAALAAGDKITLDFSGSRLLSVQVDEGTLNALAENKGLIRADNGKVILTASAKDALLNTVVNNEGVIEAKGIDAAGGTILLLGGLNGGTVKVAGTLDASASGAHDGGFIETSGAHVQVAGGAKVSTLSETGKTGTWLVDPTDFTVSAGSAAGTTSGIGADTLSANLATTNVTLATDNSTGTDSGDINVNAAVSWGANTTLTLNAYHDININAAITATGTSAGLVLNHGNYASTGTVTSGTDYNVKAPITLSGANATLGINGTSYTLIHSMAQLDAIDSTGLGGNYALAQDLDAGGITYTSALVGSASTPFSGRFAGLGHAISNLTISAGSADYVGLFAQNFGTLRDLGLVGGSVSGGDRVGGLAGYSGVSGSISNAYVAGSVSATGDDVGGLVGRNYGTINSSHATGSVAGTSDNVGGLAGWNSGSISDAYATASVSAAGFNAGGLVGWNDGGTISNAYATGSVLATAGSAGGLTGTNGGSINDAYATGSVSGDTAVGGLAGVNAGSISNAYATGSASGTSYVGGVVGWNLGSISNAYATGSVSGGANVGGLVGLNDGSIGNAYWDSSTTGQGAAVGTNSGTVTSVNAVTSGTAYSHGSYTNLGTWTETVSGSGVWVAKDGSGNPQWVMVEGATRPFLYSEYSTSIRNAHQLQLMAYNLSASYSLAADVDASETAGANPSGMWTTAGFSPVGNDTVAFSGSLDGQSHTITDLVINRGTTSKVGLFGQAGSSSVIQGVGLLGGRVTGRDEVGGLVGHNEGGISNAYATGTVSGANSVGGLVGFNFSGSISNSFATGDVNGAGDSVGGLLGFSYAGSISGAHATGAVDGSGNDVGGLVGHSAGSGGSISDAYATGAVNGTGNDVGGLVGYNRGSISNSYATGAVTSAGNHVGGLTGLLDLGSISNAYATGAVSSSNAAGVVGGLVGYNSLGSIGNAHATGAVSGVASLGGLVGYNYSGSISDAYATGNVSGSGINVGGLVGLNDGSIGAAHATGAVSGTTAVGGLVGRNSGSIGSSYAIGTATGTDDVGGLVGFNFSGTNSINNVYAMGAVSASNDYAGGLVGRSGAGSISNAYATGAVSASNAYAGGLMGWNAGSVLNTYATGAVSSSGVLGSLVGHNAGSITASFWLGAGNTGVGTQAGSVDALTRGLSGSEATSASIYSAAGWDIATTGGTSALWRIYEGNTMPLLRSFLTALTVTAGNVSKTYDGTTSFSSSYTLSDPGANTGLILGTASYDTSSKNVGSYAITVGGLYSSQQGYDLISAGTASITAATLTVSGATAADKTYDGTTAATVSGGSLSGLVGGDAVTLSQSGSFSDKNAGTGKTVTETFAISGSDAGNYVLASNSATTTASITAAALTVTANNDSRVADGSAYSGGNGVSYSGFVNGETASVLNGRLVYGGSAQGATAAGSYSIAAGGLSSGNYTLSYVDGALVISAAAPSPAPSSPVPLSPVPLSPVPSSANPSLGDAQQRAVASLADWPKPPANPHEPLRIEYCGLNMDQPATDFFTRNENKLSCMSRLESR
jgi:filamentous hemagglutinin family protein